MTKKVRTPTVADKDTPYEPAQDEQINWLEREHDVHRKVFLGNWPALDPLPVVLRGQAADARPARPEDAERVAAVFEGPARLAFRELVGRRALDDNMSAALDVFGFLVRTAFTGRAQDWSVVHSMLDMVSGVQHRRGAVVRQIEQIVKMFGVPEEMPARIARTAVIGLRYIRVHNLAGGIEAGHNAIDAVRAGMPPAWRGVSRDIVAEMMANERRIDGFDESDLRAASDRSRAIDEAMLAMSGSELWQRAMCVSMIEFISQEDAKFVWSDLDDVRKGVVDVLAGRMSATGLAAKLSVHVDAFTDGVKGEDHTTERKRMAAENKAVKVAAEKFRQGLKAYRARRA